MEERIKSFITTWEEKRLNNYYTGTEAAIVMNTFAETCKMFGYDFEIFRTADNKISDINISKI